MNRIRHSIITVANMTIYRGYLTFFSVRKDQFLFHRMNAKAVFSQVAKLQVKMPLLVFMSEIKINVTRHL